MTQHTFVITENSADFIIEAGTVATECGLTPRQLLDQRNELLEAVKSALQILNTKEIDLSDIKEINNIEAIVKKAEVSNATKI